MPPDLDIYVISGSRDRETIERFLASYVDRRTSEDRGDEELMMLPLSSCDSARSLSDYEWEPARSLTHIVERGLDYPRRGFCVYLTSLDASLSRAILSFTDDDRVIFGVSLDDEGAKPENFEKAKRLMHQMAREFAGQMGFIGVEEPPPLKHQEESHERWVHSWVAD
jgi:hypothetical protein